MVLKRKVIITMKILTESHSILKVDGNKTQSKLLFIESIQKFMVEPNWY